jgi:hypothetical protein
MMGPLGTRILKTKRARATAACLGEIHRVRALTLLINAMVLSERWND